MNLLLSSRAVYRVAGRDYRELIFFSFMAAALFFKFYFLEYEVSRLVVRVPLSVAASAAIVAMFVLFVSLFWRRGRFALALLLDFLLTALVSLPLHWLVEKIAGHFDRALDEFGE